MKGSSASCHLMTSLASFVSRSTAAPLSSAAPLPFSLPTSFRRHSAAALLSSWRSCRHRRLLLSTRNHRCCLGSIPALSLTDRSPCTTYTRTISFDSPLGLSVGQKTSFISVSEYVHV